MKMTLPLGANATESLSIVLQHVYNDGYMRVCALINVP